MSNIFPLYSPSMPLFTLDQVNQIQWYPYLLTIKTKGTQITDTQTSVELSEMTRNVPCRSWVTHTGTFVYRSFSEYPTVHQSSPLRRIAEITNQTSQSQFPSAFPWSLLTAFFILLCGHEVCSQSNGRAYIVITVGLNKNVPKGSYICLLRPQFMNYLEGSGGVASLEEACQWEWALKFQKPH